MAGLDPAIHVFRSAGVAKTWIRGSSPRMTCFGGPATSPLMAFRLISVIFTPYTYIKTDARHFGGSFKVN